MRIPSLRMKNGQYSVRLSGKDYYLGHEKRLAEAKYKELLALHFQGGSVLLPEKKKATFSEILSVFAHHVDGTMGKKRLDELRKNCADFGTMTGDKLASAIVPSDLARYREMLAERNLSIYTVNQRIEQIKRVFRYAVEVGLVDVKVYQALQVVENAKLSRHKGLRPPKKRPPVPVEFAVRVINTIRPIVRDLLLLQLYTGARPGEINRMRKRDLNTEGDVWIYEMKEHKTIEKTGESQLRYLGKRCQQILAERIRLLNDNDYVFASRTGKPITAKEVARQLTLACDRMGVERFCPYQLRHTAGTIGRQIAGLDGAQALLGHSSVRMTENYAERVDERAMVIAREFG